MRICRTRARRDEGKGKNVGRRGGGEEKSNGGFIGAFLLKRDLLPADYNERGRDRKVERLFFG